ncbi:MAG: MaoC family dehydratase [Burkholderiales bacterium]|jgi:acyl dehydratase|nr:MaoC family dehydratase [Burkholderiales bacterium]
MTIPGYTVATIGEFVGKELGVSQWLVVDQRRIDEFADCTGDRNWIHVDVERAKRESPFGGPIAHGYLSLSLLAALAMEIGAIPPDAATAINYGIEKARFMSPVKAGARVRNRLSLASAEPQKGGMLLLRLRNTLEIDGETKPALVAETLALIVPRAG